MDRPVDRRRVLAILGAAGLGTVGAVGAACSKKGAPSGAGASAPPSADATGGQPDCVLSPELTEGPYYIDLDRVRSDITEGRSGAPMNLAITVVDATTCKPVKDAAVDVWHCDAGGEYSGFGSASGSAEMPGGGSPPPGMPGSPGPKPSGMPGGPPPGTPPGGGPGGAGGGPGRQTPVNSSRFLRGTQITDATGRCTFQTVYPGWYTGRTVHVHVKVHRGGNVVHTGQLFFDDDFTDTVYKRSPYASRPARDTRNEADSIFGEASGSGVVDIRTTGSGYDASVTLGIKPA